MKRYTLVLALSFATMIGAASLAQAGRFTGPGTATARANARSSVWYTEVFRGGETIHVNLSGDGDTDLDLYVYDSAGRMVARAVGLSDVEHVSFFVGQTGTYRIEVRNLGAVWNQFHLNTN